MAKVKKIVRKTKPTVETPVEEVVAVEEAVEETVETPVEEVDLWSKVMTKKNWIEDVEAVPTIVDTKAWKIHVKANANRWSFEKGKDYFVSARVASNYEGLFEIIW